MLTESLPPVRWPDQARAFLAGRLPRPSLTRPSEETVSELFRRMSQGDELALSELLPLVYRDLHRLASRRMRDQPPDHTLGATALVNEVYLKLFRGAPPVCESHGHFLAQATRAMRQVLVDHARAKQAQKRNGTNGQRVPLDDLLDEYQSNGVDLLALEEALLELAARDEDLVRLIELRFFADMTIHETAAALDVSPRTVERDWVVARTWLQRKLA
jgi:RNA polymerase sigma factor (TIGR02999 family)